MDKVQKTDSFNGTYTFHCSVHFMIYSIILDSFFTFHLIQVKSYEADF